jgi:putative RNA 2'-phosphotransferase
MEKYNAARSRKLAFLLRHDRSYSFDEHGWREVSDLIEHHGYTLDELSRIVDRNNKKRFEFSEDFTRIRARQGHSVSVNVELEKAIPPAVLFHGTSAQSVDSILKEGIRKGNRLHVHLSATEEVAESVGQRHGTPVVLRVDAGRMYAEGHEFYLSRNGVWLTDFVSPEYVTAD